MEDTAREYFAGFLSQQVHFAEQQPMIPVVDLSELVRRGANKYAVNVSERSLAGVFSQCEEDKPQDEQKLALPRPLLDTLAATEYTP